MKFVKNNQNGHSLLSKCCLDAKIFLSAIYKKSTQARKHQADGQQCGRSMVEMLGVLAIIGVLSVGGIAGYAKAMNKYKLNKTIDEITGIMQNFRIVCHNSCYKSEGFAVNTSEGDISLLKKLKVIPDYMWQEDDKLKNSFGGETVLQIRSSGQYDVLRIIYYSIPKDICIGLLSADWSRFGDDIFYVGTIITKAISNGTIITSGGDTFSSNELPISMEKIYEVCNKASANGIGIDIGYFYNK